LNPLDLALSEKADVPFCRLAHFPLSLIFVFKGSANTWRKLWPGSMLLYSTAKIVPIFAPALQELVGVRAIEVLPALQGLFLERLHPSGSVKEALDKFTDARLFLERPIAISLCNEHDLFNP